MGQPIVVIEKPSIANPGMVRFETNRAITGMGHEVYPAGTEVRGDRPPDEIARRLYAHGGIEGIHINGSVVIVDLAKGARTDGMREIIESLFIHYPPTAEDPEQAVADAPESQGEVEEQKAAAPAEVAPDPKHTDADAAGVDDTADPEKAAAAAAVDEDRSSERADATDDLDAARTTASGTDPDADSTRPPASAAARAPLDPGESPDPG